VRDADTAALPVVILLPDVAASLAVQVGYVVLRELESRSVEWA